MTVNIPKSIADLPVTTPRWVGQPMKRVEDPMLLTGRAEFTDDVALPGMLHCAILRSPQAHARIRRIDARDAEQITGVVAVITGDDARRWSQPLRGVPQGWTCRCLAVDTVRFVGEPVAAVAAVSRYVAEDALEHIIVEYDSLPVVGDPFRALDPASPLVHEEQGTNLMWQQRLSYGDVELAFAEADHVFSERFRWHRMGSNPIETDCCISRWDPTEESVTVWGPYQNAQYKLPAIAMALGLPTNRVRLMLPAIGGNFGVKGQPRSATIAALLSRKSGGRPVKWTEDRVDHLLMWSQAWDRHYEAALALRADGTVTGLKVKLVEDAGATSETSLVISMVKPLASLTGCYKIANAEYDITCVATNKPPQSTYRGAGPPPHHFVLEQLMDIAARGLGVEPAELRRKNFIQPSEFPYTIPTGSVYDSGQYEATLDKVLQMANCQELRRYQATARRHGRHVGIGVVSVVEVGGGVSMGLYSVASPTMLLPWPEGAVVRLDALGKLTVEVGFAMEGQGQFTFVTQLLADYFCVEPSDIKVITKDTATSLATFGPGASRQAVTLTGAILGAADLLRQKLVKVAAQMLEANPDDVELKDGRLRVRGVYGKDLLLPQVAATMLHRPDLLPPDVDGNPSAAYVFNVPEFAKPDAQGRRKSYLTAANACHLALVEVDPTTGQVEILKYFIVDDCGTRLNPASVEGQTQGGFAQGVGAALFEEHIFDEEGQHLTTTFMDYLVPTVHEVPFPEKAALVTPSPFAPLGAKGMGEGPMHTTPAAIFSAINDALAPLGVRATEVPASPERLWNLIQSAGSRKQ